MMIGGIVAIITKDNFQDIKNNIKTPEIRLRRALKVWLILIVSEFWRTVYEEYVKNKERESIFETSIEFE